MGEGYQDGWHQGRLVALPVGLGDRCAQDDMARLAGIEPTTLGFGGQYSIH